MQKERIVMQLKIADISKLNVTERGQLIRNEINKEYLLTLDFSYLTKLVESWWKKTEKSYQFHILKIQFQNLLINNIKKEDFYYFDKIGLAKYHISAICIKNIFNTASRKLAFVAHEAISELLHLNDLKYPYEEHKLLYLKPEGIKYEEWGNGLGKITPHSDDLYEKIDTDFLSLTTCSEET